MNATEKHSSTLSPGKMKKTPKETDHSRRPKFWNGTLVDDYNFLMSEELICRCKNSLGEPFSSLNDLSVHRVSHNEFEKQYGELSHWCDKIYETITKVSSNALTRYLRQKYYEELYDQGLMRLRMFGQYADKLIERFPDLKQNIDEKLSRINRQWNFLESRLIDFLDDDFNRILQDLNNELFLFEQWLSETEEQLWRFESIRTDDISIEDFRLKLNEHTKLQDDIKSRNSRVSTIIEICERLQNDFEEQAEKVPCHLASDLENRWHQTWINSVEIQCKLEERLKNLQNTNSFQLIDKTNNDKDDNNDEEDIIPFDSSEYEKIPLTPSNSSLDSLNSPLNTRKRPRSPTIIPTSRSSSPQTSFYLNQQMAKSKRRMSLNLLPLQSPSTFYYSLTNINEFDDPIRTKKQKKTMSKLDVGYESEDETNDVQRLTDCIRPIYSIKKSHSDYVIGQKSSSISTSLTYSLPLFEQNQLLPSWWRHSITSAYDTCSNPDIDLSLDESKKQSKKTSLLMYSKKYTKYSRMKKPTQIITKTLSPISPVKQRIIASHPTSNSYDASAEYTDPEQSENDVDLLSSDFNSTSPVHHYPQLNQGIYNRYTATTGYASDIEFDKSTTPSETDEQQQQEEEEEERKRKSSDFGEVSQMKIDRLTLPLTVTSDGIDQLNSVIINQEKIEGSEPCWDGYQNPLFYPLNSTDMDSIETTLKWEDQFLEMDQLTNSSSDDEHLHHESHVHRTINGSSSSSSLIGTTTTTAAAGGQTNKQRLDSDSDLDDFNYVLNETEKQLFKARQSLEKKKRQQNFALNDRQLRKYDEVLRTCETNIQCLQQILTNLHRSKNSRLNSVQAIEQLQTYLSGWHDMRQQVNDDRTRARQLLYISQEITRVKVRVEDDLLRFDAQFHYHDQHPWINETSLIDLMRRINYELESDKDSQQKLASYRADILLAEEHLNEYRMSHFDGPSSSNIDEHFHGTRQALEQLTDKIETYQNQLRTLAKMIDCLMPIERQIEQKLNTYEYNHYDQYELQDIQRLIDQYEQIMLNINRPMIPKNNLHSKLKVHGQTKLDVYRRMIHDFLPKSQSKHVSFDAFTNLNNNNSSRMTTSASPTPQLRSSTSTTNKYRRTEMRRASDEINEHCPNENSNKQTSTSSYISDDCKVLYIETVIEVAKPVFYERNAETTTTTTLNTEYHHQTPQNLPTLNDSSTSTSTSTRNYSHLYTNDRRTTNESSDDEFSKPVNFKTSNRHEQMEKISQMDSGIEYDHTSPPASSSSSSTIFNQRSLDTTDQHDQHLLIPPVPNKKTIERTILPKVMRDQSTLIRRNVSTASNTNRLSTVDPLTSLPSYWTRFKQIWFRSFLVGLLMLFILFFVYFSRLDTCSRTTLIRSICEKIICIEHDGLPTI